ncbi:MAG: phenylalanine--tRNA ligase subunit beta, partial [Desulfobacterales bacterium]
IKLLSEALIPGTPLNRALGLSDGVLDIDLTPNRPDCLSVIGVAREVAAIQKTSLTHSEPPPPSRPSEEIDRLTSVSIEDPDLCPRYAARLIEGVTVGPSPQWLRDRLLSVGQRPINNLVDVTNYVMIERGQPLHAFDLDRLAGNRIVVRRAKSGERFVTLDQKERLLDEEMLMICDGEKPVAIGGIMGGFNSEIEPTTQRVLLESAYFNPVSIRRTAKTLGLNTEASHRFERGVDPEGTIAALNRAAELIAELSGGRLVEGVVDVNPLPSASLPISLSVFETNRLLGTDFTASDIAGMLRSIGFQADELEPNGESGGNLIVHRPSARVDVALPEDLMEEVARLWGYNRIQTRIPKIRAAALSEPPQIQLRSQLRAWMTGVGFTEAITYSFISESACDHLALPPDDERRRVVRILNPISEDQSVMRSSLVPGLLETLATNLAQQTRNLRVFEVGMIFLAAPQDAQPSEREMLTALWSGSRARDGWWGPAESCDFFDIKGVLESLLTGLKVGASTFSAVNADSAPFLKPGHGAGVAVGGRPVGIVGEVHPDVLAAYDIKQPAFVFDLHLAALGDCLPDAIQARPIPRFPGTTRDMTLIVDRSIAAVEAMNGIDRVKEPLVESVELFDVFEGSPIPEGKKSLSIRVAYRSQDETLEDSVVNGLHQRLTQGLIDKLNASLP